MAFQAQLWHIYFAPNCRHTRPNPKHKYVVIVHNDGTLFGCLINSTITNWLRNQPALLACEATILANEHTALTHDSFVDCQDLYPFADADFDGVDRGEVSVAAKQAILTAIQHCPTIAQKHKTAILIREGLLPPPTAPT